MNHVITMCYKGYVLLPIECKDDVKNFKITTAIKPTAQELFNKILNENNKKGTVKTINESEMILMNELIDKEEINE